MSAHRNDNYYSYFAVNKEGKTKIFKHKRTMKKNGYKFICKVVNGPCIIYIPDKQYFCKNLTVLNNYMSHEINETLKSI